MKAMILAAGRGERMRPLTEHTPKPLLKVGGHALIDYPIRALAAAGIADLVINLSWHGDQIRAHVGDGSRYGVQVDYSEEGPEPLETGGGIHCALPLLGDEPFWLVNADVYCEYAFREPELAAGAVAHLVMVPNPAHNPDGDFRLTDGQVQTGKNNALTYSGLAILSPALLAQCSPGRFPLAPLLQDAAVHRAVTGELFAGLWRDVGTPERLEALDQQLGRR